MASPILEFPLPDSPGWNLFWDNIARNYNEQAYVIDHIEITIPGVPTNRVSKHHLPNGLKFAAASFNKNRDDGLPDNGLECVIMWLLRSDDCPMYIDTELMASVGASEGDLDEAYMNELQHHLMSILYKLYQ